MPELPEVETIVRYLKPRIRGRRILKLKVIEPRVVRDHVHPWDLAKKVEGKKIKEVSRLGKCIIIRLSSGERLLCHLMMTGVLFWNPTGESPYDRLVFQLSGGNTLVFNDIRKFGRCRAVPPQEEILGEDALSLTFQKFKSLIQARQGRIKPLLLNQNIISGIGNIYSDEILWHAGIHPLRRADTLTHSELQNLYNAARTVLKRAIRKEGSSMRWYRKPDGQKGGYYEIRKAYRKTGERCLRDQGIIQRLVIGGRSAHFCPRHQR